MATIDTLKLWLAEAEVAYHKLNLGQQAKVFVDQNGERIEYNASTRGQLLAYIESLKLQINGTETAGSPLKVWM